MKNIMLVGLLYAVIGAQVIAATLETPSTPALGYQCRAIAVTGFSDNDDDFTEDSNRAILTVVDFSIDSASDGKERVALQGRIAPRDITMGEAFKSTEVMLDELKRQHHVLPQVMSPDTKYASNPDAPCNSDTVKTEMINQVDNWVTSAFPRYAKTPAPGKAHSVIVYAWRTPTPATAEHTQSPPQKSPPKFTAAELEQQRTAQEAAQATQQQAADLTAKRVAQRAAWQRYAVSWVYQRDKAICLQKLYAHRYPGQDDPAPLCARSARNSSANPTIDLLQFCTYMRSSGQPESRIHAACDTTP